MIAEVLSLDTDGNHAAQMISHVAHRRSNSHKGAEGFDEGPQGYFDRRGGYPLMSENHSITLRCWVKLSEKYSLTAIFVGKVVDYCLICLKTRRLLRCHSPYVKA